MAASIRGWTHQINATANSSIFDNLYGLRSTSLKFALYLNYEAAGFTRFSHTDGSMFISMLTLDILRAEKNFFPEMLLCTPPGLAWLL